jgi:hypothetical protein
MTTVTPPHWGERSYLYDKSLGYVFSLDIDYELADVPAELLSAPHSIPLQNVPPGPDQVSTYRVLPSDHYDSVENIKRDVPRGRISLARDSLSITAEGAVPLDGRVLIDTEARDPIIMTYTGVLSLSGGTAELVTARDKIRGTAFIASQQEVSVPRYKWLVYNQLIGIGRALALPPGQDNGSARREKWDAGKWHLQLSFDLYLGS